MPWPAAVPLSPMRTRLCATWPCGAPWESAVPASRSGPACCANWSVWRKFASFPTGIWPVSTWLPESVVLALPFRESRMSGLCSGSANWGSSTAMRKRCVGRCTPGPPPGNRISRSARSIPRMRWVTAPGPPSPRPTPRTGPTAGSRTIRSATTPRCCAWASPVFAERWKSGWSRPISPIQIFHSGRIFGRRLSTSATPVCYSVGGIPSELRGWWRRASTRRNGSV